MREFLDRIDAARPWLAQIGFADPQAAHRNLVAMAERGVPLDLLENLRDQLARHLTICADPDRALNNLERVLANVHSPLSFLAFHLRINDSLATMLRLFSASQYFSDLIIARPEYFDYLWERGHARLDPKLLRDEVLAEINAAGGDDAVVMNVIRRFRQREILRIGYRDVILGDSLAQITESISDLADCLVDVALALSYQSESKRFGQPRGADGSCSRLVVLGMGKLGGRELNYSSDIDLMLIYDHDGETDGRRRTGSEEFFTNVVRRMVKYLSSLTSDGQAYRVDLRLRPHGGQAPLCLSLENTLAYYDRHGRTWERQALVKARPIAGFIELGEEFLRRIEPFIYRKYLTHIEINEIKSIKRSIERKTQAAGAEAVDLKTGHGGIRDIEFVTQFLQLVNGGAMPNVRDRNTLTALQKLADCGCINADEHSAMASSYQFLRTAEHRLQFLFDLQTHRIPEDPKELDKLAIRLGYLPNESVPPGERFHAELRAKTSRNRGILNHLMHDLFPMESEGQEADGHLETDLILDPNPEPRIVHSVLSKYGFSNVESSYRTLDALGREDVPFLSSIRCRHFLANVAGRLLQAIAAAPDPDMALVNLEKVTASLGAKGVLWESFSRNPSLLKLYVNLCSWSQYLSEILINNAGMIDELLETLMIGRLPDLAAMHAELQRLIRGACEIDPILHSFKNTNLLQIGVADILGKSSVQETSRRLSDLAETIVRVVADYHSARLRAELGCPTIGGDRNRLCPYVLLGLGSFGAHSLNFHSDLDLVLIYEADGKTVADPTMPVRAGTPNHQFFQELVQRIVRTISQMGPHGRLYALDLRLRPMGGSGTLALPLEQFRDYYESDDAALWEHQALTRARVVAGDCALGERVMETIKRAVAGRDWLPHWVDEALEMRKRLQESRPATDLKRGAGGIVDVEFAVQLLQIKHGRTYPEILEPNYWTALNRIRGAGIGDPERLALLERGYTFLRGVESRLRIVYNVSRDDLPTDPADLHKLALRLGYTGASAHHNLSADLDRWRGDIRSAFLDLLNAQRGS